MDYGDVFNLSKITKKLLNCAVKMVEFYIKLYPNKVLKGVCKGTKRVNNGMRLMWQWQLTHANCTTDLEKKKDDTRKRKIERWKTMICECRRKKENGC